MNKTLQLILLFVSLLLLQVFVLNNILFLGYVNPYIYIVFVFLFPLSKNRFNVLLAAFFMGLCIDAFSNSGGIHTFATVFIAFIRTTVFKATFKKDTSDYQLFNLRHESFDKVFNYTLILTVVHHFILFTLTNFSFYNFSNVVINTLFSSIFTLLLYFLGSFIFRKKLA